MGQESGYPVPFELINSYPDMLRPVMERNDPEAWGKATWWLERHPRWTRWTRQAEGMQPGHGLVLFGPVGSGKTTIAATWLNQIAKTATHTVAFLGDDELAHMIRWRNRDSDVDDEYLRLQRIGFVVVDDLLRLGGQQVPLEVEAFIRARARGGVSTIVTLNNSVQLPETLESLLKTWTWAIFEGKDLRDPDTAR